MLRLRLRGLFVLVLALSSVAAGADSRTNYSQAPGQAANAISEPRFLSRLTNQFDRAVAISLVSRLDPEVQRKLGYDPRSLVNSNELQALHKMMEHITNSAARAAAAERAEPQPKPRLLVWLEAMEKQRQQAEEQERIYEQQWPRLMKLVRAARSIIAWGMVAGCLALYLYICHCCRQLCWRTGTPTRVVIWLPRFKRLALFRATGVSNLWFWYGFLVPFVGLWGWVLCCWRLCGAFQKSKWLTLAMVCPFLGWIAFIWLAAATRAEDEERAVKRLKAGYTF